MGFGKDGKGVIIRDTDLITLGALASNAVVKQSNALAIEDDFRIIKLEVLPNVELMTAGEGQVVFGIADDELTVTEIAEALVVDGPVDRNDRVKDEQASRPVWALCQMNNPNEMPNNGMPIEKTLRWTFSNPEGWAFFAFNVGATLTTGGVIRFQAKFYGVWVT